MFRILSLHFFRQTQSFFVLASVMCIVFVLLLIRCFVHANIYCLFVCKSQILLFLIFIVAFSVFSFNVGSRFCWQCHGYVLVRLFVLILNLSVFLLLVFMCLSFFLFELKVVFCLLDLLSMYCILVCFYVYFRLDVSLCLLE